MTSVGAYEAKTHLPRLLDEVAKGATITITKHGREVARLVPVGTSGDGTADDVVAALRVARRGVRRGRTSVRSMIADGRR
ncbi:MAG: type II toxin-antitoxin system prevent-host-death family antitoxin [Actinomycetota bacterium]|nr:type II toxin-antitoxin system prevent-host-death family antitoxin [Actinomycetota bacterium]